MALQQELAGLLVVSLEQAVAAPYCGLLLADAGARVIKVERPEGDFARQYDKGADGHSVFFAWLNRGKQSIALDLAREDDARVFQTMLESADVFVSNLAPGALERRGFDWSKLQERNPGLVHCAISGYGASGPGARKKAYDGLVQGESGLCSVTGTEQDPARVGISVADISTGLTAYSAILRALIGRGKTGTGCRIEISMFDVLADWMNMPLLSQRYLGGSPPRLGLTHSFIAPYGAYATKGGEKVLLSVQNNREWQMLCRDVLAMPELADDPRFEDNSARLANRTVIDDVINSVFCKLSRVEAMARLDSVRIANAQLSTVDDLSVHECLNNQQVEFANAQIEVAALPVRQDGHRIERVPTLDEHGAQLRKEFAG